MQRNKTHAYQRYQRGMLEIHNYFNHDELNQLNEQLAGIPAFNRRPSKVEGFEIHPGFVEMPERI